MALDSTGFKRKRFDDLFSEMETKAKEVFGQQMNTTERSVLGIILRLFAWFLSIAWQNSEDVYNSGYVNTAEGVSLDKLGPYAGIKRIQALPAKGRVQLSGTPNYTIPPGFRVSGAGQVFETEEPVTLSGSGTGSVAIRAITPGKAGNVSAGVITTIVNTNANVSTVTNAEPTFGGREKETAKEFRDRFAISSEGRGKATVASIRSELLKTPGVRAATVIENYDSTPDADGRPPHCFEAYVLGGMPQDIAKTILNTKAAGVKPHGSQSIVVKDDAGYDHTMSFSYATEVEIHVRFTIVTDNRYPSDGDNQLKTATVRYIGGEDASGSVFVGLNMGDDVVYSRLIAAAYNVEGVIDVVVELSNDGASWTATNQSIATNQVAQTRHNLITVVHSL
ncbi:baseplate J/gp47 family protein [Paenibacillus silviterrae]|uniref:baseplate J/gp47 family protein n=2 Tax=Paenibacillus silviterrae TaxID=3242194 RepID=UPI002543C944|nr:baseplate J/gp47 family protein [Paenibacillus chinjuensis]